MLLKNTTPVKTGVLWGCIDGVGYGPVLRAGAPALDDHKQIEHIGGAVAVHVAAVGTPAVDHREEINDVDDTVVIGIGRAVLVNRAFISYGVAAVILVVTIDLIWCVTTDLRVADGGVIIDLFAQDPAASMNDRGRVARDRAACDGGVAVVVAIDPAADQDSVVARDRAATDGGAAVVVAVDPAAVAAYVVLDRAVADGRVAFPAEDPAAVVVGYVVLDRAVADGGVAVVVAPDPAASRSGRVARDRAATDGGVAASAVDPAAVGGISPCNDKVLDLGSRSFARVDHEHAATLLGINGHIQIATGTTDGDGLVVCVDRVLVIRARCNGNGVAIR